MTASEYIAQTVTSDLNADQIAVILPTLASLLKSELKVAEMSLIVGIMTIDEFDEIEILLITGDAA